MSKIIIAVAGASGSGKTTTAEEVINRLRSQYPQHQVVKISVDNYYRRDPLPGTNWDDPASVELELLVQDLLKIQRDETIEIPTYCFVKSNRLSETISITPTDNMIVVVEGIFALNSALVSSVEMAKVFVDTPLDISLGRRLVRDVAERGVKLADAFQYYLNYVRPMFEAHVAPTKALADLVIPGSDQEHIDVVIAHITRFLYSVREAAPVQAPGRFSVFPQSSSVEGYTALGSITPQTQVLSTTMQ